MYYPINKVKNIMKNYNTEIWTKMECQIAPNSDDRITINYYNKYQPPVQVQIVRVVSDKMFGLHEEFKHPIIKIDDNCIFIVTDWGNVLAVKNAAAVAKEAEKKRAVAAVTAKEAVKQKKMKRISVEDDDLDLASLFPEMNQQIPVVEKKMKRTHDDVPVERAFEEEVANANPPAAFEEEVANANPPAAFEEDVANANPPFEEDVANANPPAAFEEEVANANTPAAFEEDVANANTFEPAPAAFEEAVANAHPFEQHANPIEDFGNMNPAVFEEEIVNVNPFEGHRSVDDLINEANNYDDLDF